MRSEGAGTRVSAAAAAHSGGGGIRKVSSASLVALMGPAVWHIHGSSVIFLGTVPAK